MQCLVVLLLSVSFFQQEKQSRPFGASATALLYPQSSVCLSLYNNPIAAWFLKDAGFSKLITTFFPLLQETSIYNELLRTIMFLASALNLAFR